jgi:hypothetical protein
MCDTLICVTFRWRFNPHHPLDDTSIESAIHLDLRYGLCVIGFNRDRNKLGKNFVLTTPLSYFEIVFSVLTGFSVNLSANLQAVEIIWE